MVDGLQSTVPGWVTIGNVLDSIYEHGMKVDLILAPL